MDACMITKTSATTCDYGDFIGEVEIFGKCVRIFSLGLDEDTTPA